MDIRSNQLFDQWNQYALLLVFQCFFFLMITFLCDKWKYSLTKQNNQALITNQQPAQDPGVLQEVLRVENQENQDSIKAIKIHKVYPNGFHAVKGTTFGVQKGQIFGLLGPNGAGKSTTFNIITANIPKCAGKVFFKDKQLQGNQYFDDVGVCPQGNCLWDFLSPVEHLRLFGRIKGLEKDKLEQMVNYYNLQLDLDKFQTKSANLSGGNKRKLCVANALIGSPSLLFLDEPSTGLDPIAKRQLWKCLKEVLFQKQSSIVLTTHSLQEAEDLCDKISIQVNGEFVCLDSLQNLRDKYGNGYKIYIKLNQNNQQDIRNSINQLYNNAKIMNEKDPNYLNCLIFQVSSQNFSFAKTFQLLFNELKLNQKIEDFSISQSTLEEIFVYFSQFQQNNNNIN
ncbi:hypothetical protein IMG5_008730 [Ichthyophthirius multifiliis]|uniref:ABC transporter domain-containing protein n=1 Tax=Ichthyophthirius multifiliis TaxID=5932 RepID=G0QJT1_ICHMU|nr:hypothetical protein IMG5_008730 [Ichthyophthirius multifiliis]EGR34524.1 hypothetical protein IMG5_008730 [Ichthyophthirius multifiliis]|eukprot:XP_004039828.1 hypothetical protein IMG5_008730 [Ichthyophthirius multifiliis]